MGDRHKRMGMVVDLQRQLAVIESRMEGLKDAIVGGLLPLRSYLDLDAANIHRQAEDFHAAWREGQEIRKRIEQLENA